MSGLCVPVNARRKWIRNLTFQTITRNDFKRLLIELLVGRQKLLLILSNERWLDLRIILRPGQNAHACQSAARLEMQKLRCELISLCRLSALQPAYADRWRLSKPFRPSAKIHASQPKCHYMMAILSSSFLFRLPSFRLLVLRLAVNCF